jgi:hypothetical protein
MLLCHTIVVIIMSVLTWSGCGQRAEQTQPGNEPQQMQHDTLYNLDEKNKTITQPVDEQSASAAYGHVRMEVVRVTNPDKYLVSFEVFFQPEKGEKTMLGTFSLYPSDNPGKFIVPTQNKITAAGKLILELKIPDTARGISITTTRMTLLK